MTTMRTIRLLTRHDLGPPCGSLGMQGRVWLGDESKIGVVAESDGVSRNVDPGPDARHECGV